MNGNKIITGGAENRGTTRIHGNCQTLSLLEHSLLGVKRLRAKVATDVIVFLRIQSCSCVENRLCGCAIRGTIGTGARKQAAPAGKQVNSAVLG